MPLSTLRLSALTLAFAAATGAQAQSFSGVITFGDSLSDSGNVAAAFNVVPDGNSFTTNNDPVYAQIVAAAFGYSQNPYSPYIAGTAGTDYAVGGACARLNSATFTCANSGGQFSISNQLSGYLADPARGGHADPHTLYMIWGGGNDVATAAANPATAAQNVVIAADAMVGLIGTLQDAGARTIVVFNQYDGGRAPAQFGTANQAGASALTAVFNSTFNAGLANLGDGIVPINVFGLFNEFIANPGLYGLTNVTDPACGAAASSLLCGAVGSGNLFTYAPGSNETYLFADGAHPSGAAHARLARVVLATLSAPGQVSMAAELPLQAYDDHRQAIDDRLFDPGAAASDEKIVYARVRSSQQQFAASASTRAMDNHQFTATVGTDVRYGEAFRWGAAVSIGDANGDDGAAAIGGAEMLASVYGVGQFGKGYVDAIVSGGSDRLDIDRRIALGGAGPRVDRGRTHATHRAIEIGGGFAFGSGNLQHGPFASLAWQKVDVHGYAEASLDSTAMNFDDFGRDSLVGRLGYQLHGRAGHWQPFGRVAYARDGRHDAIAVRAGSNTMNGHFTLAGFQPARDWFEADVGVDYALSDKATLSFGYRARLGDNSQDLDSVDFGVRWTF